MSRSNKVTFHAAYDQAEQFYISSADRYEQDQMEGLADQNNILDWDGSDISMFIADYEAIDREGNDHLMNLDLAIIELEGEYDDDQVARLITLRDNIEDLRSNMSDYRSKVESKMGSLATMAEGGDVNGGIPYGTPAHIEFVELVRKHKPDCSDAYCNSLLKKPMANVFLEVKGHCAGSGVDMVDSARMNALHGALTSKYAYAHGGSIAQIDDDYEQYLNNLHHGKDLRSHDDYKYLIVVTGSRPKEVCDLAESFLLNGLCGSAMKVSDPQKFYKGRDAYQASQTHGLGATKIQQVKEVKKSGGAIQPTLL